MNDEDNNNNYYYRDIKTYLFSLFQGDQDEESEEEERLVDKGNALNLISYG